MTIESIFNQINADKNIQLGAESHKSLEVFSDSSEVFYVPTLYNEIIGNMKAKFVIFSAPGASGKSALARYIAKKYKGIYWNLANIQIGENTFFGTLWKALKQEDLFDYWNRLKKGKSVLVLDAFDEAEMISGRTGIEYFLRDLSQEMIDSEFPSVILLARTETALFLVNYCKNNNIPYAQYEIGFFTESNAKTFVEQSYLNSAKNKNKIVNITPAISNAISAIFARISDIINDSSVYESFIGYAPILQAIERMIEEENNTAKLLSKMNHEEGVSEKLIYSILRGLLEREQNKVIEALIQKWVNKDIDDINWGDVYSIEEQVVRIMEYVVFGTIGKDSLYESHAIPGELIDDYLEVILPFLSQHPFIRNFAKNEIIDFTGPAFRDYAVAYVYCGEYDFFAKEFLANKRLPSHYPSQLLFDFYKIISDSKIKGDIFPVLYESFKAKEKNGYKAIISLCGGENDLNASFSLVNDNGTDFDETYYFTYKDCVEVLNLERISDGNIDFDGTVEIKGLANGSRIADSSIYANKLVLSTDRIELDVSADKKLIISSRTDVTSNQVVSFDIRKAQSGTIIIDFPNIKSFFKLIPYAGSTEEMEDKRFLEFKRFFVKVLNSMRAHSKDMPAKDREKIDYVYIGDSKFKKAEMDFLISKNIFFIDKNPNQSHLYKLRTEELAKYNISWTMVNRGEDGNMKQLFTEFIHENPDIEL